MEEIIFPNQIRMYRRLRGKSMQELADYINVSLSAISKIEKGYRRVDQEQLVKFAEFLDCPIQNLFVNEQSSQHEVVMAWRREQERRSKLNERNGLKTLGAGLRQIRNEKNLTLIEVAENADMTLSVYHRIEMGQREVEENILGKIAHALGYSETDLQLKIYELDMSGALDELKNNDKKTGIETCKGGYNDLPVSRFMMKDADSQEITVPIYGMPYDDSFMMIDKSKSVGSVICPSTVSKETDLYGVRLMTKTLGSVIPKRSVLVIAPNAKIQEGDIAVIPVQDKFLFASVGLDNDGNWFYTTALNSKKQLLSFDDLKKVARVIYIAIP